MKFFSIFQKYTYKVLLNSMNKVIDVKKLIEFSILRMEASLLVENELNVFASISSESSLSLKDTRFSDYEVYRHYSKEFDLFILIHE